MKNSEILEALQGFTARRAVGASTVRRSRKGTVETCRRFLSDVDLSLFGTSDPAAFSRVLDSLTKRLALFTWDDTNGVTQDCMSLVTLTVARLEPDRHVLAMARQQRDAA